MLNASGVHDLAGGFASGCPDARSSRELYRLPIFKIGQLPDQDGTMVVISTFPRGLLLE